MSDLGEAEILKERITGKHLDLNHAESRMTGLKNAGKKMIGLCNDVSIEFNSVGKSKGVTIVLIELFLTY